MANNAPLCSIITVNFNNADELEKTIKSVANQNYKNFEFIIIDGGSTDNSLNVIKKYQHLITTWVSEDDEGIYDAMNKGIKISQGRWLNFMNAGDIYVNDIVLFDILNDQTFDKFSFLIGNTIIKYDGITRKFEGKIEKIHYGTQFIHQSTFISRDYHQTNLYDANEKIAADYKFFLKALNDGEPYHNLNKDVCFFLSGGLSDTERIKALIAGLKISLKISFSLTTFFKYVSNILMSVFKLTVKSILPKKAVDTIVKIKYTSKKQ